MKKVISVLLAAVMVVSIFAGLQISSSALAASGKCGDNAFWSFDSSTGTLTISGTGAMYDYEDSPFENNDSIYKVCIEYGITRIGNDTFHHCDCLQEATIPITVSSIGDYAFSTYYYLDTAYDGTQEQWDAIKKGEYNHGISGDNVLCTTGKCGENVHWVYDSSKGILTISGTGEMYDESYSHFTSYDSYYSNIQEVIIENGVTSISDRIFSFGYYSDDAKFKSIIIPTSVISIGAMAIYCSSADIFYTGTQEQWNNISKPSGWDSIHYRNIYYNYYPHQHQFEDVITEEPTCTYTGVKSITCSICGFIEKTEEVSKNPNNHDFNGGFCSRCGIKDPNFDFPILTETCTKTVSIVENNTYRALFTPTQNGKITFYSTGDDDTWSILYLYNRESDYKLDYLKSNDNSGEGYNFRITYNVEAGKEYVLSCGSYSDSKSLTFTFEYEVELHVHSYVGVVTTEPTCTQDGVKTFTCTCGEETYTEPVPALGHTVVNDKAVAATCTKTGKTAGTHCSVCGEVLTAQTVTKALGHKWDAGKVTKKATPTATGIKTYTCKVCKAKKTEKIAKCAKYANTLTVKGKKATVKYSKLKKANQLIARNSVLTISKAQGKLTYAKTSGNKNITINKTKGIVQVKKGLKKGTYKIGVKVTAAGNATYKSASKTATITIVVK